MQTVLLLLSICILAVRAQFDTTVHPGDDCLPPDGSVIPNCHEFVDADTLEPVFIEHSYNCSRFYVCGPDYEYCLFECAVMEPDADGNRNLFFDKRIQYPMGPVCDWPFAINCTNENPPQCRPEECPGVACNECKPDDTCTVYECCESSENVDCVDDNKPICSGHICVEGCRGNSDCPGHNEVCDTSYSNCQWCDNPNNNVGSCKPGCITNDNCPTNFECNNHQCESIGCLTDDDCVEPDKPLCDNHVCVAGCRVDSQCPGYNNVCNAAYDNCFYCNSTDDNVGSCNPGCIDNQNCPDGNECTGEHICVKPGGILVKSVEFTTYACQGCSGTLVEDGLIISLTGNEGEDGAFPLCTTNNLDHPDRVDYSSGVETVFTTDNDEDKEPLGSCYKKNLNAGLTAGKIGWTSKQGTWSAAGKQIKVTWTSNFKSTCCCMDKDSLDFNETTNLRECGSCDNNPCP